MMVLNAKIVANIIISFLWILMGGFSVLVIGTSMAMPDYILKNPCWLMVICLVFKWVCIWTKLPLSWKVDMGIRHLLGCFVLYFTHAFLFLPFFVATYFYWSNGNRVRLGYVVCFLILFMLNGVSRLIVFIRWHRIVGCDKSLFVRSRISSKSYKIAWTVLSVETLLMIFLYIVNLFIGK